MLVIVEGLDRCGKSTLVEYLRKKYFTDPRIIVHHSSSPPNVEDKAAWEQDHYSALFSESLDLVRDGWTIIFDRFHLGAIVYGHKYRNANPKGIYDIDEYYLKGFENIGLVLLTDYSEKIASRDDGDSLESSIADYDETRISFIGAFSKSNATNKLHINITDNGGFVNTAASVTNFLDNVKDNNAKSK